MARHEDPICGMPVGEVWAAGRSEYRGHEYYFCSAGCHERFNEDPGRYAANQGREGVWRGPR